MTIALYDKSRNGKPVNPALALYRHWHYILQHASRAEVDSDGDLRANIRYGDALLSAYYGKINYAGLTINTKGHFVIPGLHGYHQRDKVAEHTFLRWHYFRGYSWFVDTETTGGGYNSNRGGGYDFNTRGILGDPDARIPYLAESAIGPRWSGREFKLEYADYHGQDRWLIRAVDPELSLAEWDVKRERRYDRIERERQIRAGLIQPRVRKPVDEAAREQREDDALQAIVAHMNVRTPAKTKALRRTTEEVV